MTVERDGIVLQLIADDKQRVRGVSVTAPIPSDIASRFYSEISKGPDGIPLFDISKDIEFSRGVLKELQLFESTFAFLFIEEHPLDKIRWERWEEEILPDTEEEKGGREGSGQNPQFRLRTTASTTARCRHSEESRQLL